MDRTALSCCSVIPRADDEEDDDIPVGADIPIGAAISPEAADISPGAVGISPGEVGMSTCAVDERPDMSAVVVADESPELELMIGAEGGAYCWPFNFG